MSTSVLFRPTFADLRAEVERCAAQGAPAGEVAALIEQFLTAGSNAPLPWVEYDGTVTWLYRDDAAREVAVVGDIIGYNASTNRMACLPGSDLHYLTTQIPLDAQIEYVFAVDNPQPAPCDRDSWLQRCKIDPLNPSQIVEIHPLRAFSTLAMPNSRRTPELEDESAARGSVAFHVVGSAARGDWRRVWVYLPPEYDPLTRRYPALYLNDGEAYLLSARAPEIVDALLAQVEIVPMIMVFVQSQEPCDAAALLDERFVRFLADELAPWIDTHYATSADPRERTVGGAGLGAALSLYTALERPDAFGRVIAQSPPAGQLAEQITPLLDRNAARGFGAPHCYVDSGRYQPAEVVQGAQSLCDALLAGGAAVSYQSFAGDGSFLSWRTTLPDALRFHFGTPLFPPEL